MKYAVPYVSVWDGGLEIETTANVDIMTGEITDIESVDVRGVANCDREYIILHGKEIEVYPDEHGYDYWADINESY